MGAFGAERKTRISPPTPDPKGMLGYNVKQKRRCMCKGKLVMMNYQGAICG
jgi:hypothetical protein